MAAASVTSAAAMIAGDIQVALARRRRPDADRLVGHRHVLEVAVDGGVHGDGLDAQRVAGAQDAQRDFAAVGDDDFLEHGGRSVRCAIRKSRTSARRTRSAGRCSTRIARTVPDTSASIGLNIFIASMMPSVSPALTVWPTFTKAGESGIGRGVEGADHRRADHVAVGHVLAVLADLRFGRGGRDGRHGLRRGGAPIVLAAAPWPGPAPR